MNQNPIVPFVAGTSISTVDTAQALDLDLFRAQAMITSIKLPKFDDNADFERVSRLRTEGVSYRKIEELTGISHSTAHELATKPDFRHGKQGRTPYLSNPDSKKKFDEKVLERALIQS